MTSPDIALLPLIEEWVENYQQAANDEVSERACVHELVLMFIRCCGLSSDVTEDEAMDTDGVVDALERIQDESVKVRRCVSASRVAVLTGDLDHCCDLPPDRSNERVEDTEDESQPLHTTSD